MEDLREFEERLDFQFDDYSLLQRALTHRSFVNENPQEPQEDNERLEFLGDAVIDFVVAAYLFEHFPDMDEGQLTMLRSALVRTNTLAGIAQQLGVGQALQLGIGEDEDGKEFIRVYVRDKEITAKIPKMLEGFPIKTLVSGEFDAY